MEAVKSINTDKALSNTERLSACIEELNNPYCFLCGKTLVKVVFNEDAPTLDFLTFLTLGILISPIRKVIYLSFIIPYFAHFFSNFLGSCSNLSSKNHMVWRIAVYIRLSKDDGNDESLSVTNQKKIIREYLENFFEEEYILVDIYIDDGISGTTDDARTEFIRMIDDVKAGLVNCIICKTLARTFRNYADQGYYLEELFPLYNTRFICLGSP